MREKSGIGLIKAAQGLSIKKIITAGEAYDLVANELDTARRTLSFFKEEYTGKGKKKHRSSAMKRVKELEETLATTVKLPTLMELQEQDEGALIDSIQLLIVKTLKFYKASEVVNEGFLEEVACLIAGTYCQLTLEDLALCFHQAKVGEYGKVFGSIDGDVIMGWLAKYKAAKTKALYDRNQARAAGHAVDGNLGKQTGQELARYRAVQPKQIGDLLK